MSILFATPCYGGQCTVGYLRSVLALKEQMTAANFGHAFLLTENESLITRARNTSAARFLNDTDFEFLFFIDADIEFTPEDVGKLLALDEDIAVGCYRMKRPGSKYAAWVDGRLIEHLGEFSGPISVDYAGTGFMLIRRSVFRRLQDAHPEWKHREGNGIDECWAFFQTPVEDGIFLSEDYHLCKRWRELGGKIIMDPSVKLIHHGSFAYGQNT